MVDFNSSASLKERKRVYIKTHEEGFATYVFISEFIKQKDKGKKCLFTEKLAMN